MRKYTFVKVQVINEKSTYCTKGKVYEGDYPIEPRIGGSFVFIPNDLRKGIETSTVVNITEKDGSKFIETKNSIYKLTEV